MIEVIAGLLLLALMILIITGFVFAIARVVMWRESRKPLPVTEERWEYSDCEDDDGGRAA